MEWLSPRKTGTKTSGLGTAPRKGVVEAGGLTGVDWQTLTGSISERMSTATRESCGISMTEITEVSNQPE